MRELLKTKRFELEFGMALHRGLSTDDWEHLAYLLAKYDELPEEYDEHPLTNNWQGYMDCHLEADLVVVYKRTAKKIVLTAIGTHAELFPHRKNKGRKGGLWGWLG